jgi:hypothetical protein
MSSCRSKGETQMLIAGHRTSIFKVRNAYYRWTGRTWPEGDEFLKELANEASSLDDLLLLMRENDEPGASGPPEWKE